jgi:ECF transporter S component (folate family)
MNTVNLQYILMIFTALAALILVVHYTTKTRFELRTMVIVSFMSLLSTILAAYLSVFIPLFGFPSLKFGFSQLPIMIVGAMFGPWWGMVAGVLEDLLELASGTIASPYIGFTLNKAMIGIIPGIVFLIAAKYPKKLKPLLIGLVALLYSASLYFIITTESVTASQVTYVLTLPVKAVLIAMTIAIVPIAYFANKALQQKNKQQSLFQSWLLSVILIEILVNVILTPLWLYHLYGIPIEIQIIIRSIKASFFVVLNSFLAYFIYRSLNRLNRRPARKKI